MLVPMMQSRMVGVALIAGLLASCAAQAQQPLTEVRGTNTFTAAVQGYLPGPKYLPYDPGSDSGKRLDAAATHLGSTLALEYHPLRGTPVGGFFISAGGEADLVENQDRSLTHAEDLQYGVGWSLPYALFARFTHNDYTFHGDYADSGKLIWHGLSVGASRLAIPWPESMDITCSPEFYVFPPHNEYDPNPGIDFADRVTARYAIDLRLLAAWKQHPQATLVARVFLPLGDSRPQIAYNWKADFISVFWQAGLRYQLPWRLDAEVGYAAEEDAGGLAAGGRPRSYGYLQLAWRYP